MLKITKIMAIINPMAIYYYIPNNKFYYKVAINKFMYT